MCFAHRHSWFLLVQCHPPLRVATAVRGRKSHGMSIPHSYCAHQTLRGFAVTVLLCWAELEQNDTEPDDGALVGLHQPSIWRALRHPHSKESHCKRCATATSTVRRLGSGCRRGQVLYSSCSRSSAQRRRNTQVSPAPFGQVGEGLRREVVKVKAAILSRRSPRSLETTSSRIWTNLWSTS